MTDPVAGSRLHVPDGAAAELAIARTTHLGVGAHPDDLEMHALAQIGECHGRTDRWFTGVVCTDGAGGPRRGPFTELSDDEMVETRWREQRQAADLGAYSAVLGLGHPSAGIRTSGGRSSLVDELIDLIGRSRPEVVVTHEPTDRHPTHVAVVAAVVDAVRALGPGDRPAQLLGSEGWRDLGWLPPTRAVRLDVSEHTALGRRLLDCHRSQIEGGKRYDLAVEGRRRAHATLFDPWSPDVGTEVLVAMDLSPLLTEDPPELARFVGDLVEEFGREIDATLRSAGVFAS